MEEPTEGTASGLPTDRILSDVRAGGNWIPVATRTVEKIVSTFLNNGAPFPEEIALMDLHYWCDKGTVKPYRYYCGRWDWGEKRVRNLFTRLGLMHDKSGAQAGRNEGASGAQKSRKPEQKETVGAQAGRNEGASGAQYRQTSDYIEELPITPTVRVPLRDDPPDVEYLIGYGATTGIPEGECRACFDYYEARGWLSNGNVLYSWQSLLRSWHLTEKSKRIQQPKPGTVDGQRKQSTPRNGRQRATAESIDECLRETAELVQRLSVDGEPTGKALDSPRAGPDE